MGSIQLEWLNPIPLTLKGDDSETALIKRLKREIKSATSDSDLKCSVYIVRLVGRTAIVYDGDFVSSTVYIGRGDSVKRLANHLKAWASGAFSWGHNTSLEIHIVKPRMKNDKNCFKNVEADLIRWFHQKAGMLPLVNSRFETSFEGCVRYRAADEKRLKGILTLGRGKRPHWALYPLKSNPHYETYYKRW